MANDPTDDVNIPISIVLEDTPDTAGIQRTSPTGISATTESSSNNPVQMQIDITTATGSEKNPGTGWLGALWDTTWGKLAVIGTLSTLTALGIYALVSSGSNSSSSGTKNMTPAQAAVAQTQLRQVLSRTSGFLKAAGYDPQTILRAQNQVNIIYGTPIALSTIVPDETQDTTPLFVVGRNNPMHYASLETLDTQAYLSSLSRSPAMRDITKNSAAVHGLKAIDVQ